MTGDASQGVMLCSRPSQSPKTAETTCQVWKVGAVSDTVGLTPKKASKNSHDIKVASSCAEAQKKHRQYLHELSMKITEVKDEEAKREADANKIKSSGQERYAQQRQAVSDLVKKNEVTAESLTEVFSPAPKKPQWALTTEEASAAEEVEQEELLQFASELTAEGLEKYMEDLEVRNCFALLKQKIDLKSKLDRQEQAWREELVKEFNKDDVDGEQDEPADGIAHPDADDDQKSLTSASALAREAWNSSVRGDQPNNVEVDPLVPVLMTDERFKSTHSAASLSQVLSKVAQKSDDEDPHPIIVVCPDYSAKASEVSQLPYLYRSPAV